MQTSVRQDRPNSNGYAVRGLARLGRGDVAVNFQIMRIPRRISISDLHSPERQRTALTAGEDCRLVDLSQALAQISGRCERLATQVGADQATAAERRDASPALPGKPESSIVANSTSPAHRCCAGRL